MTDHHCTACHEQFSEISGFDAHRKRGKCVPPRAGKVFRRSKDAEEGTLWVLK